MTASRGPGRVLIVDDQPANIRLVAEALREDHELFFATSGARALEVAAAGGIDLVLLDVVMPGEDGFEVCRRLKADEATRRIPVIFVTARDEVDDETRGFDVGGVDYITKPISPPKVRARVRTHLELKHTRDLLEQLASRDALTGVGNRRQYDEGLEQEWRRARRSGRWLTLALVDVDFFKKFNDRYGHARGDDCLRTVAEGLSSACRRPADLVARYGGEEFGLVLPETDPQGARAFLARVHARMAELALVHEASTASRHVTVSIGALSIVPGESDELRPTLERVDRLLYEAKEAGRNRSVHLDAASGQRETITAPPGGHP